MVCAKSVLVVAIVDGNLDGNGCIDQADDCGWDTYEVSVASISSTCEAVRLLMTDGVSLF